MASGYCLDSMTLEMSYADRNICSIDILYNWDIMCTTLYFVFVFHPS